MNHKTTESLKGFAHARRRPWCRTRDSSNCRRRRGIPCGSTWHGDRARTGAGDTILGFAGNDSLDGGAGSDTFVIVEGDGGASVELADVIFDFVDGSDLIGLADGLAFGDLTIDQSADVTGDAVIDTVISVATTGEFLAVLDGIGAGITIDQDDFTIVA